LDAAYGGALLACLVLLVGVLRLWRADLYVPLEYAGDAGRRFWKKLRRRATHNRLFDTLADLKASLRASLCYFQTMRREGA
jgi:hypothetical protein